MRDVFLSQQKKGENICGVVGSSPSALWGDNGKTDRSLGRPALKEELMSNTKNNRKKKLMFKRRVGTQGLLCSLPGEISQKEGTLIKRSSAEQEAILGVKEETLEIRERLSTVLNKLDVELGLGQGSVMAHVTVNIMGAKVGG